MEDRVTPATWSGDIFDPAPGVPLWTNGEVQEVIGDVHVPAGKTLTIQPGTVVQFDGGESLVVDGTVTAVGTSGQPIVFTSVRDNSQLGGSNTASSGDWQDIQLTATSSGNVLDHVAIRYAGGGANGSAVTVAGAPLALANSTVSDSVTDGVRLVGSNATLTGDTFANNGLPFVGSAIHIDPASQPVISGATFTNNRLNGVSVDGGTLPAGTTTWNNPGAVYVLSAPLTVPVGSTLAVGAGQVVKFVSHNGETGDNLTVAGTLSALGTAAAPIIFTSPQDDSAGGDTNNNGTNSAASSADWRDIGFTATSTGNVLDHVAVRFAGGVTGAAVIATGAPLALTNSTVSDSFNDGVRLVGSNATLTGDTFANNGLPFAGSAIHIDPASQPVISGATFTNNRLNGVSVDGGTLPAGTTTWNNAGIVYQLADTLTVPVGGTLALGAGQIVKVAGHNNSNDDLIVNGTLTAHGTASQPVIVTSYRDDSAGGDTNNDGASSGSAFDWHDIRFTSSSTGNVLDHVDVRYGDANDVGQIVASGAPLAVTNSVIRDAGRYGLGLVGSNAVLTGDSFQDNGVTFSGQGTPGAAVHMDAASQPVIATATFTNNRLNGVAVDGTLAAGTTTWNNTSVVYVLDATVTVPQGSTLAIAAGQIVKPLPGGSGAQLEVDGTLVAQGTAANPVVFTSPRDDSVGGDTSNDGASTGSPGDWKGILFAAASTGNILNHVVMKYGSDTGSGTFGMIGVVGAPVTIADSFLGYSGHMALFTATGADVTLTSSFVVGDSFNGIQAEAGSTISVVN
ncbi:MAG TPA: right-handed parallel beta-helix repeat-containing protein, partial [Urbifossiella sp.]|nr:right-handed parallel beta-helix repeat-containing protein [Urbifossiella sp.]